MDPAAQDYAAMAAEQIPRRSLAHRLRSTLRWVRHDLLGSRSEPLDAAGEAPAAWTTPHFDGASILDLARAAAADAGPLVRRLMRDHAAWGGRIQGSYDAFEAAMLYHLVRRRAPRAVFELGPNRGYSTAVLQAATAEVPGLEHRSYDLHDFEAAIRFTVARHGSLRGWRLFPGPFEQVVHEADHLEFLERAEVVFVDAAHTRAFGEFYVDQLGLLDRTRPDALIQIHDMYPADHPAHADNLEAEPVFAWLERHREEVEVLWNFELCRLPEVRAALPEWIFYDHRGYRAANPSLWIRRSGAHGAEA